MKIDLELGIAIIALLIAAYSLVAAWLARRSISGAFAFLALGVALGGAGLASAVETAPGLPLFRLIAELTLALVLFSGASTIAIRSVESDRWPVLRLLVIGLPLTIAAGSLLAWWLFGGLAAGIALIIGAALAPTDADLGQQVVTDRTVPARVRRLLSTESGLNDGIAAPVVTIAIAIATAAEVHGSDAVIDAVRQLLTAAVAGGIVGLAGGWLVLRSLSARTSSDPSRQLAILALAIGAYFLAAALGASGFIAAFVAGLGFRVTSRHKLEAAVAFTETQGVLLSIIVWFAFGVVVAGNSLAQMFEPTVVLYAILSLTVVRMVPVALSLISDRFAAVSVAFIGWFGPRGLATIVFALLAIEALDAAGVDPGPLRAVVGTTVLLSVALHGLTAHPLARWYGRWAKHLPADAPEFVGDHEPRRKATLWTAHVERAETPAG